MVTTGVEWEMIRVELNNNNATIMTDKPWLTTLSKSGKHIPGLM